MLACNFIKTRLQHRFFPVKFEKFLRIPILKNIYERLLSAITFAFQKGSKMYLFSEFLKKTQKNVIGCLIIRIYLRAHWWWIVFVEWLTSKRSYALFPTGIIVSGSWHWKTSDSSRGFKPVQNLSLALLNEVGSKNYQ